MILLVGIPTEAPLALVRERLESAGMEHRVISQRRCLESAIRMQVAGGDGHGPMDLSGVLEHQGESIALESCAGIYLRLMDDTALPELAGEQADSPARRHVRAWHEALTAWCEVTPRRVANRMSAMGSNASKPFQAQAIVQAGFSTPETLVTSDPEAVRRFHARHGRVIFKSLSGVRSIVKELDADDLARLEAIRWCPVQFQAFVPGENVRVHVVGEEVFATLIHSEATDYRYATRQTGSAAELEPTALDPGCEARCVALASALGLPFAGIDLKVAPDGQVFCFEVNPSPGYSYYEGQTGQPISAALAEWLAAG